jgi:hypothetical protein
MKTRRLRWHGPSRQEALANRLRLELGTWQEGWSVDPTLLSLRIADAGIPQPSGWRWTRAISRSGGILLGADAATLASLGGLLAQAASDDPLGLGRRVGERALRALLTQFVGGAANLIEIEDASTPAAEDQDPRFGGCSLVLQGTGFEARLLVDNELFEYWVHPQQSRLPVLLPRDASLGKERVVLDVVLDLGSATLADAQQLQIGDVLVSSTSIDSIFHLALPDSRRLVTANLVRKDGRRALQIDASSLRKVS